MIVLVCGGRDYFNRQCVAEVLDALHKSVGISHVIHGDYRGADKLADAWALDRGVQPVRCPALWDTYRRSAGPRRNRAMALLKPDLVVAFPGGNGTDDMVTVAEGLGIQVKRIADEATDAPQQK